MFYVQQVKAFWIDLALFPRLALNFGLTHSISGANAGAHRVLSLARSPAGESAASQRDEGLDQKVVQLYDALRAPLYRYLLSTGLPPEHVEEVVQETFLRLYKHLRSHRGGENLRGWIFQVAHNLSANIRRERRRHAETTPEAWVQLSESLADRGWGPEELLLRKERMDRVNQSLQRLTQLQRDCLFLRIEGFRYREIGTMLNIGTSTVAGSLRNALNSLTKGAL